MLPVVAGSTASRRASRLAGVAAVLVFAGLTTAGMFAPSGTPAVTSLLDRARLGTWSFPAKADRPVYSLGYKGTDHVAGYQESDLIYVAGTYYLFSTGSQEPAWVDVYAGRTPEDLVRNPPTFTHVAPIRYPTVVKDGNTWHLWGVNPPKKTTEHWISTQLDPTGFTYADTPFPKASGPPLVDFAVRKRAADGRWYGVGFEPWNNSPLLLATAPSPSGPWEKLNYQAESLTCGIFGDAGSPPWGRATRPDPDLAFTADGRAWVFFSGLAVTPAPSGELSKVGMVEVNLATGKAMGNAVVLLDPERYQAWPFAGAADLSLITVPGQPDRIFGEAGNPLYPLVVLQLPRSVVPTDGRTSADLVRLDMARRLDVASGLSPLSPHTAARWGPDGLTTGSNGGGQVGYLASGRLADLTLSVDFTPVSTPRSALSVVAHVGAANYDEAPAINIQLDSTGGDPLITATLAGSDTSRAVLKSDVVARAGQRYSVVLRREGGTVTLAVNGDVAAEAEEPAHLSGLAVWSLGAEETISQTARYPFQGTVHSFVVTASGEGP